MANKKYAVKAEKKIQNKMSKLMKIPNPVVPNKQDLMFDRF